MMLKATLLAALAASVASAQNLTATLSNQTSLTALTNLVSEYPGLLTALDSMSNITLLAPSNAALSAFLNTTEGKTAAGTPGLIEAILSYHVLPGMFYASNITSTAQFVHSTLTNATYSNVTGGQVVECIKDNTTVTFFSGLKANATVTQANLNFTGGVIHVVDSLLMIPEDIAATAIAANLTALAGAVQELGVGSIVNGLSDVTIFAPDNSAFQAVGSALGNLSSQALAGVLEYHVVNGTIGYSSDLKNMTLTALSGQNITITVVDGDVFVNSAKVINPDLLVSGGVMHIIDAVLNPANPATANSTSASTTVVAFAGASSVSNVPFTSGVATPTSSIAALASTAATTGALASASKAAGSASSSKSKGAAAAQTGAVGAAALFGGAALLANW